MFTGRSSEPVSDHWSCDCGHRDHRVMEHALLSQNLKSTLTIRETEKWSMELVDSPIQYDTVTDNVRLHVGAVPDQW